MNITVIFGAMAMVGAVGAFWWGITAKPSGARANLFAGLPQPVEAPGRASSVLRRVGNAVRRMIPNQMVDGLEVRLVQAGHPYGLDLARLLGIKFTLSLASAFLLLLIGQPLIGLVVALALFFLPDYWVLSVRDKRQEAMRSKAADTIDQLTICVEAGLGFDAALTRVANTSDGPLADELKRTLSDMQAGVPVPRRFGPWVTGCRSRRSASWSRRCSRPRSMASPWPRPCASSPRRCGPRRSSTPRRGRPS